MKFFFKKFLLIPVLLSTLLIGAITLVNIIKISFKWSPQKSSSNLNQSNNQSILDTVLSSFGDTAFAESDGYGNCYIGSFTNDVTNACTSTYYLPYNSSTQDVCLADGDISPTYDVYHFGNSQYLSTSVSSYYPDFIVLSPETGTNDPFSFNILAKQVAVADSEQFHTVTATSRFNVNGSPATTNIQVNTRLDHANQPPVQAYTPTTTTATTNNDFMVTAVLEDQEQSTVNITFQLFDENMTEVLQSYTYSGQNGYDLSGAIPKIEKTHTFTGMAEGRYRWRVVADETMTPVVCTGTANQHDDNIWRSTTTFSTVDIGNPTPSDTYTPGPSAEAMYIGSGSTPTPTPAPTATPVPTPTPIPTPVPQAVCTVSGSNIVGNGNFDWTGDTTGWQTNATGSSNPPYAYWGMSVSPDYSVLLGVPNMQNDNWGDSILSQDVTIPSGFSQLSFKYNPYSLDMITNDWFDVYITDTNNNLLETLIHVNRNDQQWITEYINLSAYANQTIRLNFLVHQDGQGNSTGVFIDDIEISDCTSGLTPTLAPATDTPIPYTPTNTPLPTFTPTPTNTPAPTANVTATPTIVPYPTCDGANIVTNSTFTSNTNDWVGEITNASGSSAIISDVFKVAESYPTVPNGVAITRPSSMAQLGNNTNQRLFRGEVIAEYTFVVPSLSPYIDLTYYLDQKGIGGENQFEIYFIDQNPTNNPDISVLPITFLPTVTDNVGVWNKPTLSLTGYEGHTLKLVIKSTDSGNDNSDIQTLYFSNINIYSHPDWTQCITPTPAPTVGPQCSTTTGVNLIKNGSFDNSPQFSDWSNRNSGQNDLSGITNTESTWPTKGISSAYLGYDNYDIIPFNGVYVKGWGERSISQQITVPSGSSKLTYDIKTKTTNCDSYNCSQFIVIENTAGERIGTIYSGAENIVNWETRYYDLSQYAGQTINIRFGIFGYPWDIPQYLIGQVHGATNIMYLDDVKVESCGAPVPTATPQPTEVPNYFCTSTNGVNVIQNPGFEDNNLNNWTTDNFTSNGVVVSPQVSSTTAYPGTYSALLGNVSGNTTKGETALVQDFTVPANGADLQFNYWAYSQDTISYDWQDVYIMDQAGHIMATVLHMNQNGQSWHTVKYPLTSFAGQTIKVKFVVHQDGNNSTPTAMYIDDVKVESCGIDPLLPDTVYVNSHGFTYNLPTKQRVNAHMPRFIGKDLNVSFVVINSDPITVPVTPDSSGNWSFVLDTPLAEGNHTVQAFDALGNPLGYEQFMVKSTISLMVVNMNNTTPGASGVNATLEWTSAHAYEVGDTITFSWPATGSPSTNKFAQSAPFSASDVTVPANFEYTSSAIGSMTFSATGTTPKGTAFSIVLGGGKLTNPTQPGNYQFEFNSYQAQSTTSDTSAGLAYIGNANQTHITARIVSTLSFNITDENDLTNEVFPVACSLGTLDTRYVNTCKYRLKVATNAENGFSVSYTSTANGLYNGTYSFTPAQNTVSDVTAGQEAYGVNIQAGLLTGNNTGGYSATSAANCTNNCNSSAMSFQSTTPVAIYEGDRGNAPIATDLTNTALVTHLATPSSTTPAGTYSQVITYNIVGRF